jgi:hypothetical protein
MTTEVTDATATQPGAPPPPFDRELAPVVEMLVSLRAPDAYRRDNITEMRQPVPGASTTRHWIARNRLEGDSPRVMVDLHYRFVIDGDRISELVFA